MDLGFYGTIRAVSPMGGSSGYQREPPNPRLSVACKEGDLAFRPRRPQGARGDVAAPASLPGGGHEGRQAKEGGGRDGAKEARHELRRVGVRLRERLMGSMGPPWSRAWSGRESSGDRCVQLSNLVLIVLRTYGMGCPFDGARVLHADSSSNSDALSGLN